MCDWFQSMKAASFSSLASAKRFALSCEGFRALFSFSGSFAVAYTNKQAAALRSAGAVQISILG
jgi:hypothetical protein